MRLQFVLQYKSEIPQLQTEMPGFKTGMSELRIQMSDNSNAKEIPMLEPVSGMGWILIEIPTIRYLPYGFGAQWNQGRFCPHGFGMRADSALMDLE